MSSIATMFRLVKFEHTVFALPFAYAGMVLATDASTGASVTASLVLWITAAMVGARTFAMAVNRLVDAGIDARNPRTAMRDIPSGAITPTRVLLLSIAALVLLIAATFQLHPITRVLWPIPVALFVLYPYTKRFTWMCHFILGVSIGLAPLGAWLAVTGTPSATAWFLVGAITTWIGGFDIIYATQDVQVDREQGLCSIPARFGVATALRITRGSHVITAGCLIAAGLLADLGIAYWATLVVVCGLLAWENAIVRPSDLSRVNAAFFTINGVLGIVYLGGVIGAVLLG